MRVLSFDKDLDYYKMNEYMDIILAVSEDTGRSKGELFTVTDIESPYRLVYVGCFEESPIFELVLSVRDDENGLMGAVTYNVETKALKHKVDVKYNSISGLSYNIFIGKGVVSDRTYADLWVNGKLLYPDFTRFKLARLGWDLCALLIEDANLNRHIILWDRLMYECNVVEPQDYSSDIVDKMFVNLIESDSLYDSYVADFADFRKEIDNFITSE